MFSEMQDFGAGPGGPMVSGMWTNTRTGQVINVRDCIIDGDQMIIISDHGQIDMNEFSRDYVQASSEIYNENGEVIGNDDIDPSSLVGAPVTGNQVKVFNDTPATQAPSFGSNPLTTPLDFNQPLNSTAQIIQEPKNKTFELIDKIFSKNPSRPSAKLTIDWTDFPKTELQMLVDYFDVSKEDISKYISKHLINDSFLTNAIQDYLFNQGLV